MTATQPSTDSADRVDASEVDPAPGGAGPAVLPQRTAAPSGAGDAKDSTPGSALAEPVGTTARVTGWRRHWDLIAALIYLIGALGVTARGWVDAPGRLLGSRPADQGFNEWMFTYMAHAVSHLENPFFTTLQNAPDGVNLMTNVGMQLFGVLLTPITLLAGPEYSYVFLITINLVGTAFAWYWVLSRHLVTSRVAAFVGGLFCAFAPALVSHSNGHPHMTGQWLVPFIVWGIVRLIRTDRPVRDGLILGGLISAQYFASLEILFLLAIGMAIATIAYLAFAPRAALRAARTVLVGLGVAGALVLVVAIYPLWMQFFGPQHRIGHPGDAEAYALTVGSFFHFATESIAGSPTSAKGMTPNSTEEATFFGWPVMILATVLVFWLRREVIVRVIASTAVFSGLLAVGSTLSWDRERNGIPGPFVLIRHLPIVDAMVIGRFALITTVALGLLFAIAGDRIVAIAPRTSKVGKPLRLVAAGAVAAALLPIMPTPLPAQARPRVPAFVTSGDWREYVAEGRTLVPVPIDDNRSVQWGAAGRVGFAVPHGYFLGPTSPTDNTGRWGVEPRPTAALLIEVAAGKRDPATITDADRAAAVADVRHWRADAVALDRHRRGEALRAALDALYGPGKRVDDVWLWDVRPLTG